MSEAPSFDRVAFPGADVAALREAAGNFRDAAAWTGEKIGEASAAGASSAQLRQLRKAQHACKRLASAYDDLANMVEALEAGSR